MIITKRLIAIHVLMYTRIKENYHLQKLEVKLSWLDGQYQFSTQFSEINK